MTLPTPPLPPPMEKEKKPKRGSKTLDKSLAIIVDQLNIATATKAPIASMVTGPVGAILDAWQRTRSNRAEYGQLAEEAIRLAYEVAMRLDQTGVESNMQVNLEEFLGILREIQEYTGACASRNRFKAFMLSSFDINEIKMQRQKLERYMRLFEFQSLSELREKTNKLLQQRGNNSNSNSSNTNNTENKTTNDIEVGDNADFSRTNGFAAGSGNIMNSNSTSSGGGVVHNANNKGNTTTNTIKIGAGANFSGSTGVALGSDNLVNSNNNTKPQGSPGNAFGSDNLLNTNSDGANTASYTPPHRNENNNANNNASTHGNNDRNTTSNSMTFGDNANLSGSSGNAFGSGNQITNNSTNTTDNSLNVHNHGSNNVNVLNKGSNNQVQIGDNNSGNQGIIGNGSNNVVNSGNNSGTQFFPNASHFALSGGEFSNVMGDSTRNTYNYAPNLPKPHKRGRQYPPDQHAMGVSS